MPKEEAPWTMTRSDIQRKRISDIQAMAVTGFKDHWLTPLWHGLPHVSGQPIEAGSWLCDRPEDSNYHFTVVSVPGRVMVFGDLGTLVVERCRDMIAWSRSAIESLDYFAEKVVREIKTKEYDPDMVRGWVYETDKALADGEYDADSKLAREWPEVRAEVESHLYDGRHAVLSVIWEANVWDEMPDFDNFESGFLWRREALKWFLKSYPGR